MKNFLYLLLFSSFLISCSDSDDVVALEFLEANELVLNYSTTEAELFFSAIGLDTLNNEVQYNFEVYEITYTTTYKGEEILASALVSVPKTTEPLPILSFQHGTIVNHDAAPTENLQNQLPLVGIASTGYIVVLPDFLGFGTSTNVLHPYYVEQPMGQSVAEAVYAAKELMTLLEGNYNGDVFLAGYSEGGYATMAAHKYMQENPRNDINLVASAPASGGYDVKAFQEYLFSLTTYDNPFFLGFVLLAYQEFYDWSDPISTVIQEPYASRLPGLYDGQLSGSQINAQLTDTIPDLIQPDALTNFNSAPQYAQYVSALEENSLLDWTPEVPVFLYHGTADITVPFSNSVKSYETFQQQGSAGNITFIPLEGGTHATGVLPYFKDVFYRLKELK